MTTSQDRVREEVEEEQEVVATNEEGGGEEEKRRTLTRWRRREGLLGALLGGRLESLPAEQTLDWRLPRLQNIEGGLRTWAGGAPGVEGGEMAE